MSYETIIQADILNQNLSNDSWLVFDCRSHLAEPGKGEALYQQSHIDGAFYAHLEHDLSSPITVMTGRHPLPDFDQLNKWLSQCGMTNNTQVVVYDDLGGSIAVRLWWLLKCLGHKAVAVLDGGWQQWERSGYAKSDEIPVGTKTDFYARPDISLIVSTEEIQANVVSENFLLIDVRATPRFIGEMEPIDPVAGHIPGAINIPLSNNLNSEGLFKSVVELIELYQPIVEKCDAKQQVYMCGSGVTACHSMLAMMIAGFELPRLYPGSWSEWIRDDSRPVAKCD